jgi:hypothetical protein
VEIILNIMEDFERISQIESLILQADLWEEEQKIIADKYRKPAIVELIIEKETEHELKSDSLALRRTD